MKIAVTGAAGFLGSNLVNQLVEDGHEVTGVDRVRSEHAPKQVKWVLGDVLDRDAMVRALDGAELVYHLIAMITLAHLDEKAWTVNTVGVRTVAEAARTVGVRRMVHCSSVHSFDITRSRASSTRTLRVPPRPAFRSTTGRSGPASRSSAR